MRYCQRIQGWVDVQPIAMSEASPHTITRPCELFGAFDNLRANGVQVDVPSAGEQVAFGFYRAALEARLPQRSSPSMPGVYAARVTSRQSLHGQAEVTALSAGFDDQVNMIVHEAVGVDTKTPRLPALGKSPQVVLAIGIAEEDALLPMPALIDVMWRVCERDPGHAWHPCSSI